MQKLFSNDTCGNSTLLYANAVSLARTLCDRCPAIGASTSEVCIQSRRGYLPLTGISTRGLLQAFVDDRVGTPTCASTHIFSSRGKPVVISKTIRVYNVAPAPTALFNANAAASVHYPPSQLSGPHLLHWISISRELACLGVASHLLLAPFLFSAEEILFKKPATLVYL